jgi:predicted secreted protein
MAQPTTLNASKLSIWIGSSSSPGAFIAPCGLTTRGIQLSASTNDITVPDCDDPDAPSWTARVVQALSAGVSGSGILAIEALPTWRLFFMEATSKMCRVVIDGTGLAAALDCGYFEGLFICSALNITGDLGNKIQVEVTMTSDGQLFWRSDSP